MSIFTFRKKMSVKKIHFFDFFTFFAFSYLICFDDWVKKSGRVHKKNAIFLVIWEYFV
jgi:hypothetical protein